MFWFICEEPACLLQVDRQFISKCKLNGTSWQHFYIFSVLDLFACFPKYLKWLLNV